MLLLEQILNGLLVGTYYTLLALGLSIIFSLGGVVNLAHGAFYAAGAYTIVFLSELIGFPSAFVATPILVGLIGIVVETFFLRRLYTKDPILTLLFTFGLAMSAEQVLRLTFGASGIPFSIPEYLRRSPSVDFRRMDEEPLVAILTLGGMGICIAILTLEE